MKWSLWNCDRIEAYIIDACAHTGFQQCLGICTQHAKMAAGFYEDEI